MAKDHSARLLDTGVTVNVVVADRGDFTVRFNRGKLMQIVDNLIINSAYWLREDIRLGRNTAGTITLTVERPFLRVSDSGRGVSPSVERNLFEPFITTKPRGEGRGLGLFIARQLLDTEGCAIALTGTRNKKGHLFTFEVDLGGASGE